MPVVLYSQERDLFQIWDMQGFYAPPEPRYLCYAESKDGIHWEKPNLGLVEYNGLKDNNIIWSRRIHQGWIMLDTHEKDPANRYKGLNERFEAMYSPAGIHWTAGEQTVGMTEEDDYSNKSREMRKKAAEASAAASRCSQSWAMLIKRVYEVDPLCCPKCGGQMKVVSFIEPPQAEVIKAILNGHQSGADPSCACVPVGGLWQASAPRAPPDVEDLGLELDAAFADSSLESLDQADEPQELTYVDIDTFLESF